MKEGLYITQPCVQKREKNWDKSLKTLWQSLPHWVCVFCKLSLFLQTPYLHAVSSFVIVRPLTHKQFLCFYLFFEQARNWSRLRGSWWKPHIFSVCSSLLMFLLFEPVKTWRKCRKDLKKKKIKKSLSPPIWFFETWEQHEKWIYNLEITRN